MTDMTDLVSADQNLKRKHRALWALGDYPAVAAELVGDLGPFLVAACALQPGERVLDVAAGSGNAAIPAAKTGAHVVASDLTPELLAAGWRRADQQSVQLDWREADAGALPFDDDAFDVVLSCIGVMFAPHHQASADELVRVCRPGGRLGLLSWTPTGFVGRLFAAMKPYSAPAPPGAQPPPLWGDEDHVRGLLGDRVDQVTAVRRTLRVDRFTAPSQFRDYFATRYGPTIAAYRNVADDPERVAALDQALDDLARRYSDSTGAMEWEFLLLTARKVG